MLHVLPDLQWHQSGLKSKGLWIRVQKILLFSGNFTKNFNFPRQISEKFRFSQAISQKNFNFPGKNWPFTATSEQVILFLFKSHHFRTYFQYMIRYNILRPPLSKI